MEPSRRYRLLIIFAALVFCLTVCFANAEVRTATIASAETETANSTPMHADFLAPLHQQLLPTAGPLENLPPVVPVISQKLLASLTRTQKSHSFWHGIARTRQKPGLVLHRSLDSAGGNAAAIPGTGNWQGANPTDASQSEQTE